MFNTLVVRVISLKDFPVKGGRHLDAYASLTITGTTKFRSKVVTGPQRIAEHEGSCQWDEHLEFQLDECYTDLTININHKSKLGTSETLATTVMKLTDMPKTQAPRYYQLHKKGHPEKPRGMLLMSFEFSNRIGGNSISQLSLNTIGKENKLEKLKRRMHFGRNKKAQMDNQSLASFAMSRRDSICSNTSALAFSPSHSPLPPQQQDTISLSLPPDPEPQQRKTSNRLSIPEYREERRLSGREDSVSQCSTNLEMGPPLSKKTPSSSRLAAKVRQKVDQLVHMGSNRKSVEEFHDNVFVNTAQPINSRPQSIASSSGIASFVAGGQLEALSKDTSKEHLLNVIGHLRKELHLKEGRIRDLEEYTGKLLSRIMERHPELLQVNN